MKPDPKGIIPRILEREFPDPEDRAAAQEILSEYGQEEWHRENERVHLAALKLAKGKLVTLRQTINEACVDYRDIIAWAENPRLMQKPVLFTDDRKHHDQLAGQDATEYAQWLNQASST